MPGKTGLSSVPRPNIRATRSWFPYRPSLASGCSAQRLIASTAATYGAACTSSRSASVAGAGTARVTRLGPQPELMGEPHRQLTRSGAIGWPGPK